MSDQLEKPENTLVFLKCSPIFLRSTPTTFGKGNFRKKKYTKNYKLTIFNEQNI